MKIVGLADAKAHLSALVALAEARKPVEITRRGVPVAKITAVAKPRKPRMALRSCVEYATKTGIDAVSRYVAADYRVDE